MLLVSDVSHEVRVWRQRLLAGLLGFVLGLLGLLCGVVYVVITSAKSAGWLSAVHLGLHLGIWAFVGALLIAAVAMLFVDALHHQIHWRAPRWRPVVRRYAKRLPTVMAAYVIMVPITFALWSFAPARGTAPLAFELTVAHVLLCGLIAVLAHFAEMAMEWLHVGRRTRPRLVVFMRVFVIWPVLASVMLAIRAANSMG
jgi:hypothetical protein